METTSEQPRLILVGSGPRQAWEPAFAALAGHYDLVLVSPGYPTWQAAYVRKHRIANVCEYQPLFSAVADLRGEVADAAVLTWEAGSAGHVAEIARTLRLRFMAAGAVRACLDAAATTQSQPAGGLGISAHAIVRDGQAGIELILRLPPAGGSAEAEGPASIVDWRDKPWGAAVEATVREAHQSIGADYGLTDTRLHVGDDGVSLAGVRTWLDPGLLPALGADLFRASAAMLVDPAPAYQ